MKVLVTGASGQVGRALLSAKPEHVEVRALTRDELDISNEAEVKRAVANFAPSVLINAAAYTAVDKAESEPAVALAVNATGPRYLAEAVREIAGARLIHISTDYVFDAAGTTAHRPQDPTQPLSVYGRTKLSGEQAVQEVLGDRAVILRTAWIYAPAGKNFLLTMLRLMKERGAVRVVADQWGSPTTAASVARAIWRIVELAGRPRRAALDRREVPPAGTISPARLPRRRPRWACCRRRWTSRRSRPRNTRPRRAGPSTACWT